MGDIRYRYLRFKLINDFCAVNKSKILLKCASLLKVLNSGHFTRNLYRYCYKSTATGLTWRQARLPRTTILIKIKIIVFLIFISWNPSNTTLPYKAWLPCRWWGSPVSLTGSRAAQPIPWTENPAMWKGVLYTALYQHSISLHNAYYHWWAARASFFCKSRLFEVKLLTPPPPELALLCQILVTNKFWRISHAWGRRSSSLAIGYLPGPVADQEARRDPSEGQQPILLLIHQSPSHNYRVSYPWTHKILVVEFTM